MSAKRPSLADSMRQVAQAEPPPLPAPSSAPVVPRVVAPPVATPKAKAAPATRPSGFFAATRAGKKKVTVALDPATHKQLKGLAVEQEKTTEALLLEAIADLFRKHGKAATP